MTDTAREKHILLIDDDPSLVQALSRALTRRGYRVHSETDIDLAADLINQEKIDYAIVDLKIGQHSGLQLLPLIKADHPNSRILVLTGYSSIATTVQAMRLGAHNYLCKPASTREIISALTDQCADPDIPIADDPPSLDRLEWEHIHRVLLENDNNISATARALGMHRRTLQRKLRKKPTREQASHHGIDDEGPQGEG